MPEQRFEHFSLALVRLLPISCSFTNLQTMVDRTAREPEAVLLEFTATVDVLSLFKSRCITGSECWLAGWLPPPPQMHLRLLGPRV